MQGASEATFRAGGGGGGGRGRARGAAAPPAGLEGRQRGTRAALGAPAAGTARLLPAALLAGGPTCEYQAGRGPMPQAGGGQARNGRAVPRTAKVHPPWQSYSGGNSGEAVDLAGVSPLLVPAPCGGTPGTPKWLGSLSRLQRTDQPRGWKQRTPDTLSSKQTPALLKRGCAHSRQWAGASRKTFPGSRTAGRSREGDGVLRPRRSAWSHPGT